jgi:hypothetical protein
MFVLTWASRPQILRELRSMNIEPIGRFEFEDQGIYSVYIDLLCDNVDDPNTLFAINKLTKSNLIKKGAKNEVHGKRNKGILRRIRGGIL